MVHPNGTLYLLCGSVALYSAPALKGPWQHVTSLDAAHPGGPSGAYEDGFLYMDPRGGWHALFHVYEEVQPAPPTCANATVSAHAFSADGLTWFTSAAQPYDTAVKFADGSALISPTKERPKLLFGADGEPAVLYNGAVGGPSPCAPWWCSRCKILEWTFTLATPLITPPGR